MATPPVTRIATVGSALLELVLSTPTVESYLDELVLMTDGLSPAIVGCGVTVRRDGNVLSVATSNSLAAAVDEVQYALGTGPCLESLRSGVVLSVADFVAEDRWGGYPDHAISRGVRSSLSVPLEIDGATVGALNCYGAVAGAFTAELTARIVEFAAQAQVALALAVRNAQQADVVAQLHTAMQSRSVIDQALGILMARRRCTAAEAFAVLRSASQSRNRKVVDIATDLITTTTGSPPRPSRFDL